MWRLHASEGSSDEQVDHAEQLGSRFVGHAQALITNETPMGYYGNTSRRNRPVRLYPVDLDKVAVALKSTPEKKLRLSDSRE